MRPLRKRRPAVSCGQGTPSASSLSEMLRAWERTGGLHLFQLIVEVSVIRKRTQGVLLGLIGGKRRRERGPFTAA